METQELGIGSRVSHPDFGAGVIIQLTGEAFEIIFMEHGWRKILRNGQMPELSLVLFPQKRSSNGRSL